MRTLRAGPKPGSWAELHLMEQTFNPGSVISFIHHRESCGRCGRVQIFSDDWSTPNIFLWYPNIFPSSCKNICESWVEKCNNYGFAGARCGQLRVMISIQSAARHNLTRSSAQIWSREVCRRTLGSHTFHWQWNNFQTLILLNPNLAQTQPLSIFSTISTFEQHRQQTSLSKTVASNSGTRLQIYLIHYSSPPQQLCCSLADIWLNLWGLSQSRQYLEYI